ncbi:(2Fe-2S)-binding protein [Leifsonia poae]|uniref:(2Fe-2S)-binding protein n=1 Tax=Leifsonia poae TaxID=110933 RepID=UPI001CBD2EBA|nr:(2Fe-2S)-binding protein [Leifsonia poae]
MSESTSSRPPARRLPAERGRPVVIHVDGAACESFDGETVASALLVAGVERFASRAGEDRLPLCNMGTCFECAITIDGAALTRACLTPVVDGMDVRTGDVR